MDYLILSLLFGGAGILAIVYYQAVPGAESLRQRLPNKISLAGLLLTAVVAGVIWYVVAHTSGFNRIVAVFILLINLLVVETVFLLILRWLRSNSLAIVLSIILVSLLAWLEFHRLSLGLVNLTVIIASLGAATLLIRLDYLRTRFFMVVAGMWTIYDIMSGITLHPKVFVPATVPRVSLFLPAVTAGQITLGSGDFMFLVLFTLIIVRDFGYTSALWLVALQVLGLVTTGVLKTNPQTNFPFLVVMTPIFFLWYWWLHKKRAARAPSAT